MTGKRVQVFVFFALVALTQHGCLLTKVVTVPMRVGGAVISIIPCAGNTIDAGVDAAADGIDDLPF